MNELLIMVITLCMGVAFGAALEQRSALNTVCSNTYQSYKDVITCQESRLDYSKIIIKEQ